MDPVTASRHVSNRIQEQPNADDLQLGRAMRAAKLRDVEASTGWFEKENFMEIIAQEWAKPISGRLSIERWQNKIRHLRQFLRGWARNESGIYKQEKERLTQLIDALDLKAEVNILNVAERRSKSEAEQRLRALLREEELKWALRAKVLKVVQGDDNTQFFHMIANGKHRKKKIIQLEQDEGTIVGHENLKAYISNYYKQLFGPPEASKVSLNELVIGDIPQLRSEENDILFAPFTEKEVLDAISHMKPNKAPGPDGFPAEF
ncbi:uncharacterized protein [Aegilops tauschii subsp. strangulata]|uniref:uncharacterized protein n=1 Tax=Aegilops tauschii subsp. strangulata TaxID=200361 RepID=UPI003CC8E1B3